MFDFPDWSGIATGITGLFSGAAAIIMTVFRSKQNAKDIEEIHRDTKSIESSVNEITSDFNSFKLEVAKTVVTRNEVDHLVSRIERSFTEQISRLEKTMEKYYQEKNH